MFRIKLTPKAKRGLKAISKNHRQIVAVAVEELKEYPTIGKPLGRELTRRFSIRIGMYRVVYKIDFNDKVVLVVNAGHRSKVYD